jgi:hypothetical protein
MAKAHIDTDIENYWFVLDVNDNNNKASFEDLDLLR